MPATCSAPVCGPFTGGTLCESTCVEGRNDRQKCVFLARMGRPTQAQSRVRKRAAFAAAALVALAGTPALVLSAGDASAQKAQPKKPPAKAPLPKLVVLGASAETAPPACPASPCQAIGKVTGYQTSIGKAKNPFVAPFDGMIVAWSIKLSAPTDKQAEFFNDFYGGPPAARISVLKPVAKTKLHFKLRAQSPVEQLTPVLGGTTTFALKTPIPVHTGHVVALSVPTWAPAFGIGLPKNDVWQASRKAGKCTNTDDIKAGSAHETLLQERVYGCKYTTARLLYSATIVRSG
jgi:hypothetical protein